MKQKRIFQIFVLLPLLFAPLGANQSVRASTAGVDRLDSRTSGPRFPGLQNEPTVSVLVTPGSVSMGGITSVMVSLNHVPAEGYTSTEVTCIYDADFVEASNIVVGNLFGIDPVTATNGPHSGQFIVAIAGSDGKRATSSGVVLAFNIRGLRAGLASLECRARVSKGDHALTTIGSTGTKVTILENVLTPTVGPALCDKVQFVADVTVPDGTNFPPGATFTKTWRLKNVGSCTWTTAYQLVFFSGEQMGAASSVSFSRTVAPGQVVDTSINLIAPSSPGSHRGYWMFKNANGALFGIGAQANKPWWVDIRVLAATPTSTTTAAMRITIDPGQTSASRIGVINPNETIRYLLNAAAGQVLSINLTAPANEVAIGVNGPTGLVLKPLDASPTWNATILEGGDHTITLMALTGSSSKSYTLQVSLTPSAQTATPTFRPTPCDRAEFVADTNIPPGTVMSPGAPFIKTWRLKNVGTCTWTLSYRMAFFLGDQMGAPSSIQIPGNVASGEMVDISLPMTAPLATGSYRGYWIFQNSTGLPFGVGSQGNEPWFVDIVVANGSVTPAFTQPSSILRLTKFSNSQTYSAPDQIITYTFSITNLGTTALGPAQFTITDDKLGAPFNCGAAVVTLAPGQSVICSRDYRITSADMALSNITNSATAAGAGQVSPPATSVVTNLLTPATPTPSSTPDGPTATPPIASATPVTEWLTFTNTKYSFELKYPPPGPVVANNDTFAHIDLPFVQGTNLQQKYLYVSALENVNTCTGALPLPQSSENVTIDGNTFLKQTGQDSGAGRLFKWTSYSTPRNNVCVSLNFMLESINSGTPATAPVLYDEATESIIFEPIVATYRWMVITPTITPQEPPINSPTPGGTSTPTATPIATTGTLTGQVFAGKPVTLELYNLDDSSVTSVTANADGTFSLMAPAGRYDILASASGHLSTLGVVTIVGGSTSTQPPTRLVAGDVNGDTYIDQYDALTIGMNYNSALPAAADLNNDGIVNVLDLELLAKNYRKLGPVTWYGS
jgi:hypothetical protein